MLFETKPPFLSFSCGTMGTVIENATIVELISKTQLGAQLLNSALELRPGVELGSLALELRPELRIGAEPGAQPWSSALELKQSRNVFFKT